MGLLDGIASGEQRPAPATTAVAASGLVIMAYNPASQLRLGRQPHRTRRGLIKATARWRQSVMKRFVNALRQHAQLVLATVAV